MSSLVIRNGVVLTESGPQTCDVLVVGDRVKEIAPAIDTPTDRTIDADGSWVGPGFVDLHVHFREPGQEHKEDVATGSRSAAVGGYTAVVVMPNTEPPIDTPAVVEHVRTRGEEVGLVDVVVAACVTRERQGTELADLDALWNAGVRMFTDDGDAVAKEPLMRAALAFLSSRGGVLSQHALVPELSLGRHLSVGTTALDLGLEGIAADAEVRQISQDLSLAAETGARYHVQHLSSAGGVGLIRAAKAAGVPVSAEVTPHHLLFTDADVGRGDTAMKMMPPLRSTADREALRVGLADGTIDAVATDHAPHSDAEKAVPFSEAPNGVIGLQWAAAAVLRAVPLDMEQFFSCMSTAPARIAGLGGVHGGPVVPGRFANLVVFDPEAESTGLPSVSKSSNSPYIGRKLRGLVRATVYAGTVTHEMAEVP